MDPKWRLFLCILTAWTSVSLSSGQTCLRPANAIRVTADKLRGSWSNQMNVNYGTHYFNYACDRVHYEFKDDQKTGLARSSTIDQGDGKMKLTLYYANIVDNYIVRLRPYSFPTVNIFMYIILYNENEFVASVCFFNNGDLIASQYTAVMTRSQTTTREHAAYLLRQAGVTYDQYYYFNNTDACYGPP